MDILGLPFYLIKQSRIMKYSTSNNRTLRLFLFHTLKSFSRQVITVILTVDTEKYHPSNPLKFCSLEAVDGSGKTIAQSTNNLHDFYFKANLYDTIKWIGVSKNGQDVVDILWIRRDNNSRIFYRITNPGEVPRGGSTKIVKSRIVFDTIGKADYKYTLKFRFKFKGNYKEPEIDPKIKVGNQAIKPD